MTNVFLEISYRGGKPFAAYLRLPRDRDAKVARSSELRPGVVVDFSAQGQALGVEIIHPAHTRIEMVLEVLGEVHAGPVSEEELAPLRAA